MGPVFELESFRTALQTSRAQRMQSMDVPGSRGMHPASTEANSDAELFDIFVCYRRDDSAEVVDRIYERLQAAYPGRVFRDVNQMQGGLDFRQQVALQLQRCQAGLVVIGPSWLKIADVGGHPRLHNEDDEVRIEIESVLSRKELRVFPLLVKGAILPEPNAVPESLRPLLRRHGYPIRRDPDFESDIRRLITALDVTLGVSRPTEASRPRRLFFFAAGFLLATAMAFTFHQQTFRLANDGHDFIKRKHAELTHRPLIADRLAINRWKENILALQDDRNGGIRNMPGSETQVWCTAQALTALLASPLDLKEDRERIIQAFEFIEQSRDKEADGWGLFEKQSVPHTEIAAWVCVANAQLFALHREKLFADQLPQARRRIERDLASIARCQLPSPKGAWSPIFVSEQMVPELARTYSTIMALWAMAEARDISQVHEEIGTRYDQAMDNGVAWLLANCRPEVGWLPAPTSAKQDTPLPGLTAQAIYVLRRVERVRRNNRSIGNAINAKSTFLYIANPGEDVETSDLMGTEASNLRPTNYKLENSSFVRFPWLLLAASSLKNDESLSEDQRIKAARCFEGLKLRSGGLDTHLRSVESWEIAETLFCVSKALEQERGSDL